MASKSDAEWYADYVMYLDATEDDEYMADYLVNEPSRARPREYARRLEYFQFDGLRRPLMLESSPYACAELDEIEYIDLNHPTRKGGLLVPLELWVCVLCLRDYVPTDDRKIDNVCLSCEKRLVDRIKALKYQSCS